jgi:hypothetical protein
MLNSIFESTTTSSIELSSLLLCSIVSIILGFVIALTHKYTSKYSKNFLITITLLPILVQSVMLMVNGNLGTSIAIMGAFGLVRFRSIPGTSKEILIVFFAMAVGLATGMGQIFFAIILTIIGCLMLVLLSNIKVFDKNGSIKELKILIPENLDYSEVFDDIFEEYTKNVSLEKTKTTNMGSMFELTYKVTLKTDIKEKDFIDKLRTRNSNLKISLSRDTDNYDL